MYKPIYLMRNKEVAAAAPSCDVGAGAIVQDGALFGEGLAVRSARVLIQRQRRQRRWHAPSGARLLRASHLQWAEIRCYPSAPNKQHQRPSPLRVLPQRGSVDRNAVRGERRLSATHRPRARARVCMYAYVRVGGVGGVSGVLLLP